MNDNYGHLDNGKLVHADNHAIVDGKYYANPSAATYLKCDPPEKLIVRTQPVEPAPAGYHYEAQGWNETDTELRVNWVAVADPTPAPRVFSKLYLEMALFNAGLLDAVDAFIDSQTITNEQGQTMPLRRAYNTALTFSEDNEYFSQFKSELQTILGLTDGQMERILSNCIARAD